MRNLLFCCVLLSLNGAALAQRTYLHCGKLLDTENGRMLSNMTVIINGSKVEALREGYEKPGRQDQLIDLKNMTVLPGLTDMHVHIEWQQSPALYAERFTLNEADIAYRAQHYAYITLMAGFTTVRDLGGTGVNTALRNAINQGLVPGPRIFSAGKSIGSTGGHVDPTNGARHDLIGDPGPQQGVINSPEEGREAVRHQIKLGADCIKIAATGGVLSLARDGKLPQLTEEEMRAIIEAASDQGIHVAAHAHGAEGMKRAVRAGVTTIEHGTFMDDETMALMKERGAYYVPTITAGWGVHDSADVPGFFPSIVRPKAKEVGPQIHKTFVKAYKEGVKICFGTDAGVYAHGKNALEFKYMVDGGMPPMEALLSATRTPAEILRVWDRQGSISPGKVADIIAVPGDPLNDVTVLQQVAFVMKDGVLYKQVSK